MTSFPPPPPLCSLRASATALASAASGCARDASSYPLADGRHGRERYGNETHWLEVIAGTIVTLTLIGMFVYALIEWAAQ